MEIIMIFTFTGCAPRKK